MVKSTINDPKTGKSYTKEVDVEKIKPLFGQTVGYEFDAGIVDVPGVKVKITGGSDKDGFPMRKGIHKNSRLRVYVSGGIGYNPKEKGIKRRKTVRGEIIGEDIAQLNLKIVKLGKKSIEEILGIVANEEEKKEE